MPRARSVSKLKRDKREGRHKSWEEKYQERKQKNRRRKNDAWRSS